RTKRIHAFFESPNDFRDAVKSGDLKLPRFPFRKHAKTAGFPQGLPISAPLANLYLLKLDENILTDIVNRYNAFYRRYSDDIIVLCSPKDAHFIEDYIYDAIQNFNVDISREKTEKFLFTWKSLNNGERILVSHKMEKGDPLRI